MDYEVAEAVEKLLLITKIENQEDEDNINRAILAMRQNIPLLYNIE